MGWSNPKIQHVAFTGTCQPPPDSPQVTPPAAGAQLQGSMGICLARTLRAGKGKGFYTHFLMLGSISAPGWSRCASHNAGSGHWPPPSPIPSGASLLRPPELVPGVPTGCLPWTSPHPYQGEPHQPSAACWAWGWGRLVFRGEACVLRCLRAQVQRPGHSAQPKMERVTVHINKHKIISKRKNTHKTCPLNI